MLRSIILSKPGVSVHVMQPPAQVLCRYTIIPCSGEISILHLLGVSVTCNSSTTPHACHPHQFTLDPPHLALLAQSGIVVTRCAGSSCISQWSFRRLLVRLGVACVLMRSFMSNLCLLPLGHALAVLTQMWWNSVVGNVRTVKQSKASCVPARTACP